MKITSAFKALLRIFLHRKKVPAVTVSLKNVKQLHQPAKVIYMYKREIAVIKK